jgi:hypothetical protein
MMAPNQRMHANRRPAFQFRRSGFFGRWIRCQCPFPAAVGDPLRSASGMNPEAKETTTNHTWNIGGVK